MMVGLTDEKGRTMRERTREGRYGRRDGDLSEDDAWWLSRRRDATPPSHEARPTPVAADVVDETVEPAAVVEEPRRERHELEWWRVDQPETVTTWSSLENTIMLRATQARTRIADIANSVHATGRATQV
jgi:hypothetical protein